MTAADEAADALNRGGLVVFPTETVFGIGCRLDRPEAVERMARVKGRAPDAPFQVLVAHLGQAAEFARLTDAVLHVAGAFSPGPLTMVVPASAELPVGVGTGSTVGVRVPDHPCAISLIERCGPLAASSANRSGHPTSATIEGVRADLGRDVDVYLDEPPPPAGHASTVVDLTGQPPRILREGAIRRSDLARVLRTPIL